MADAHKNFAASLVATAPSPATSGTSLVVTGGQGALFPAVPFNATIWPVGAQPTAANAEIVRVTVRSTDTLTITRAQESSSARTVIVGDQIAATVTAKTLTDVEAKSSVATFTAENHASLEAIVLDATVFDDLSIISLVNAYTTVAAGTYLVCMYGIFSGQTGDWGGGRLRVKRQNSSGVDQETLFEAYTGAVNEAIGSHSAICKASASDRIVFMGQNVAHGAQGTMAGRISITKVE